MTDEMTPARQVALDEMKRRFIEQPAAERRSLSALCDRFIQDYALMRLHSSQRMRAMFDLIPARRASARARKEQH